MSTSILITNLNEIKGFKVCCPCGASWSLPLASRLKEENKCIRCDKFFPDKDVFALGQKINSLKDLCKDSKIEIFIETEFEE